MYSAELTQAYVDSNVFRHTTWRGHLCVKCPLDLWMYQELIQRVRPSYFVELGTAWGGTALFIADLFEAMQQGEVIGVDVRDRGSYPDHPRITRLLGNSGSERVIETIHDLVGTAPAMICRHSLRYRSSKQA